MVASAKVGCGRNHDDSPASWVGRLLLSAYGFSDYNTCFSYFNGTWSTNGATMAPGVVWFHGDLILGVGTYENTVIATGNLTTSGSTVVHAPNYGGLSGQCNNTAFPALYPTNFCAGGAFTARETLINGVREWNREPSCSRFPHRGKEVPIEHVFRRFRVVPGA
ncbi:hypothetical protein, partial [Ralstonia pseudosolanacearum]|uniref:hypothetical protein n=1 Tax=Ralstonia pseudosolanacearum TaxID=1310165 RepID=UPI0020042286